MTKDLANNYQQHLLTEFKTALRSGVRRFDLMGGRRSGKTYFALQFLLGRMYAKSEVISVATMTDTQGRLGAYQDAKDIVQNSALAPFCEILTSPREIRCKTGGRMFFNSYQLSERAKGIACDWLYINEANNFTEQQYIDLAASVRIGVIADRNPNTECWTERNGFHLIHSTWIDNKANLTLQQIEWFDMLKAKAESPNATQADIAFYKMYYLGEYAEITGSIFTPANIKRADKAPEGLRNWVAYADPSALVGSDYFAMVLAGTDGNCVYITDTWSNNACGRDVVVAQLQDWARTHDGLHIFCETNGYIGQEFYKYARSEFGSTLQPYNNGSNKEQRIMSNYANICERVVFVENDHLDTFLTQVFAFTGKKNNPEHDDNIDAVNSAFEICRIKRYIK